MLPVEDSEAQVMPSPIKFGLHLQHFPKPRDLQVASLEQIRESQSSEVDGASFWNRLLIFKVSDFKNGILL